MARRKRLTQDGKIDNTLASDVECLHLTWSVSMIVPGFQDQLITAFPEGTWNNIVRGIKNGIILADSIINSTPFLGSAPGYDIRGLIRRVGVLYKIKEMCSAGDLPFSGGEERMPVGHWHWLTIKSQNITAHVVRTESPRALPSDNSSRQPECLKNEYDLFEHGRIPTVDEMDLKQERYAVIVYGLDSGDKLAYVALGMPNYERTGWLAYKNILRRDEIKVEEAPVVPRTPDISTSLTFNAEVQRMLEDRDRRKTPKEGA